MKKCLMVYLLITILLSACSGGNGKITSAAKEWLSNVVTFDMLKADDLVCKEQKAYFRQIAASGALATMFAGQASGTAKAQFDDSKLVYKEVEASGKSGKVSVKGELRTSLAGVVSSHDIDEVWKMQKEDGKWKWCGTAGENSTGDGSETNQPSDTGEGSNTTDNSWKEQQYIIAETAQTATAKAETAYKLVVWGLQKKESPNDPGWSDYTAYLGVMSNGQMIQPIEFGSSEAEVITEDGHSYGAEITNERDTASWRMSAVNQLSTYMFLPPGVIMSGMGDDGISSSSDFMLHFSLPSTLKPKTLLPKGNFAQIDLTHTSNSMAGGNAVAGVTGASQIPAQMTDDQGLKISLSNPRVLKWNDYMVLSVDIDLENPDATKSLQFNPLFAVIDSQGKYHWETLASCDGSPRDGKLYNHIIGPLQKVNGIECIQLGTEFSSEALNAGDYVLIYGWLANEWWYKVHVTP